MRLASASALRAVQRIPSCRPTAQSLVAPSSYNPLPYGFGRSFSRSICAWWDKKPDVPAVTAGTVPVDESLSKLTALLLENETASSIGVGLGALVLWHSFYWLPAEALHAKQFEYIDTKFKKNAADAMENAAAWKEMMESSTQALTEKLSEKLTVNTNAIERMLERMQAHHDAVNIMTGELKSNNKYLDRLLPPTGVKSKD